MYRKILLICVLLLCCGPAWALGVSLEAPTTLNLVIMDGSDKTTTDTDGLRIYIDSTDSPGWVVTIRCNGISGNNTGVNLDYTDFRYIPNNPRLERISGDNVRTNYLTINNSPGNLSGNVELIRSRWYIFLGGHRGTYRFRSNNATLSLPIYADTPADTYTIILYVDITSAIF